MGSGASALRRSGGGRSDGDRYHNHQQVEGNTDAHYRTNNSPSAGTSLPYYVHQGGVADTTQGAQIPNSGQLVVNIHPSAFDHAHVICDPSSALSLPLRELENQKASTIKNDVNLKKSTLRLERDEENPGFYLVAFSFDALVPGWICIFFLAKEGEQCSLNPIKPDLFTPIRVPFDKGLGQTFRQASGTGVNLSLFDEYELFDDGNGEVSPMVVRTETVHKTSNMELETLEIPLNGPLPAWVRAQTTHAALEKKDNTYHVKVGKQIIYVEGVRYELQEIYGIENVDGSGEGDYSSDCGKDCVICLSELRDTTVLPCRHMCMCSACAKVLRFQSSRCPICRSPVERLLQIRVSNKGQAKETAQQPCTQEKCS
ncbi:hypothetical protein KP509_10G030100 [Ceratopteris richardii]|uniref:RING-type E3 ubiquitin transferase n=1 Tax=Ceratopteris richardii TaxID=49495 RepID=A0A8T2TUK4_CERRI|nr:hypothetical protein KP509_10G030100 [Ceratopteris richardii]